MADASPALQAELAGRLILSVLLGSVLGWERQIGNHPAGLRTHMLVSLGAAAYTIAGTYGVAGFGTVQDAGRVAAQVVTGIGFIGAGTIWRSSGSDATIRGLTTAASIWVAAAIGMLSGFGLYVLAASCAVITLLVLRVVRGLERGPRALGRLVMDGVRRRRARRAEPVEVAMQPAIAAGPHAPAMASTMAAEDAGLPDTTPTDESAEVPVLAGNGALKRKRSRKKERKRKKRDTARELVDQIAE